MMEIIDKWPNWVRWILVIPAIFVTTFVLPVIIQYFRHFDSPFYAYAILQYLIEPVVFVSTAVWMAPSRKGTVAIASTVFTGLFCVIVLYRYLHPVIALGYSIWSPDAATGVADIYVMLLQSLGLIWMIVHARNIVRTNEKGLDKQLAFEREVYQRYCPVLLCQFGAVSLFAVSYILAIYEAFKGNGWIAACVMAIPVIGQLIWIGVMWAAEGFLNSFSQWFWLCASLMGMAQFLAGKAEQSKARYMKELDQEAEEPDTETEDETGTLYHRKPEMIQ